MKKIETLLAQIKVVPNAITNRIEQLKKVEEDLAKATETLKNEPSDENQEVVDGLNTRALAIQESLEERLEAVIEAEKNTPAPTPTPQTTPEPTPTPTPNEPKKKKSGWAVGIAIAVVAVVTLGAVTLSNKQS